MINISPSGEIIPLIAVRVVSLSGHKTDISVVPSKLSTIGCKFIILGLLPFLLGFLLNVFSYHSHIHTLCVVPDETSWSVDSHLMLIDSNKACDFTDEERAKILKGQILVHQSSKTIIRVWPKCARLRNTTPACSSAIDISDVLSNNTSAHR